MNSMCGCSGASGALQWKNVSSGSQIHVFLKFLVVIMGKSQGETGMPDETSENHSYRVQKRQKLLEKIKAIGGLYQLVYN